MNQTQIALVSSRARGHSKDKADADSRSNGTTRKRPKRVADEIGRRHHAIDETTARCGGQASVSGTRPCVRVSVDRRDSSELRWRPVVGGVKRSGTNHQIPKKRDQRDRAGKKNGTR